MSIILILILLVFSALISGSEIAFFSLDKIDKENLQNNKNKQSDTILELLSKPKRLLATILIANNFVNVGIVIISSYISYKIYPIAIEDQTWLSFFVQVILITFLLLLFGEVMPKVYATKYSLKFANLMVFPILFLRKIFYPISHVLVKSTTFIDKKLLKTENKTISVDDLSKAFEISKEGDDNENDKNLLSGIINFGNIEVTTIMKSRVDVVTFDYDSKFSEILINIKNEGYSRVPVYKKDFDNIAGILHIKDLLGYLNEDDSFEWQNLLRKPFFIPESKKIDDLLRDFQKEKKHMAIVVDEYGGTSGIVTLEDVIEEIIGEINDESDEELEYTKLNDNNYLFEGKISIIDFCKILGIEQSYFDDIRGDSDSLAGIILEILGEFPIQNQEIYYKIFRFRIEKIDERRIKKIRVIIINDHKNK